MIENYKAGNSEWLESCDEEDRYVCECCGAKLKEIKCKLVCERCGYFRSCSDLF